MGSTPITFVKGEKAYKIFWYNTFNCDMDYNRVKWKYPNLELLIEGEDKIIAFKYDEDVFVDFIDFKIETKSEWKLYIKSLFNKTILVENFLCVSLFRNKN
jgi:hypothetical protein